MHFTYIFSAVANRAFRGQRLFDMQLRLLAAVYILHDRCCLCMTAVVCAFHMICLQYNYTVWAWQVIFVHGRWHVPTCIMYMYHVHVSAVCTWPLLAVHEWCCICMTYDTCAVQLMNVHCTMYNCTWPLRSGHYRWCVYDSCCLYMTAWQLLPCMTAAACA